MVTYQKLYLIYSLIVMFEIHEVIGKNTTIGNGVDVWQTRAKTNGGGSDLMSRILLMMVMPFILQTSMLPMTLVSLKFMLIQSMFLGKMAIILGFVTFLRNMLKREDSLYSHNINLNHHQRQFLSDSDDFYKIFEFILNTIIENSHIGIKGIVYNSATKHGIPGAIIHVKNITNGKVEDIQHNVISVYEGDYFRLISPGKYKITAFKDGFLPHSRIVTVTNPAHTAAQRVDFALKPISVPNYVRMQSNNYPEASADHQYDSWRNWINMNREPIAVQ